LRSLSTPMRRQYDQWSSVDSPRTQASRRLFFLMIRRPPRSPPSIRRRQRQMCIRDRSRPERGRWCGCR
ncbi:hypothetical protein FRIG_15330, partial [Frigoribacterium faeni]|uniref:hypothetical protein n=1 Tax=Frigoribacterium faeni TaxID=145483 RepID=UPI001FAE4F1D